MFWKQNTMFLKHNTIFLKHTGRKLSKHNTKLSKHNTKSLKHKYQCRIDVIIQRIILSLVNRWHVMRLTQSHMGHRSTCFSMKISHVWCINTLTVMLWGFPISGENGIFFNFFLSPSIPKRDLDTKKTRPNIEVCPESIGNMSERWPTGRGRLGTRLCFLTAPSSNTYSNKILVRIKRLWLFC